MFNIPFLLRIRFAMAQPHRPAVFDISTTPPVVEGQVVWARTETHEFVFPNNLCEQKEEEWTEMRAIRDEGLSAHADSNERRLFNEATSSIAPWNRPLPDPYFHNVIAGDSGLVLGRIRVSSRTNTQYIVDEANRLAEASGYYNNIWRAHHYSLNQWSDENNRQLLVLKPWDNYALNIMLKKNRQLMGGVIGLADFCDCDKWKYEPIVVTPGFATMVKVSDLDNNFRTILINNYVTFRDIIERCKWWYAGRPDIPLHDVDLNAVNADGETVVFSEKDQDATVSYYLDIPATATATTLHLHKFAINMHLRGNQRTSRA